MGEVTPGWRDAPAMPGVRVPSAPTVLIEHKQADYPGGMYRQPRDVFFHDARATGHCPLCAHDRAELRRLRFHIGELAISIANAAYLMGVYNGEVPLTGPELIMLLHEMGDAGRRMRAR